MLYFLVNFLSSWIIPLFILLTIIFAQFKRIKVFEAFVDGAKEGFEVSVRLIPFLVGMFVAIGLFRDSGAMDLLTEILSPIFSLLNIPTEVFPLAVMRPVSGSAALALTAEMLYSYGPDSLIGRIVSTMQGSTDTTLFAVTVYFGSVGISKTRHVLSSGLIADLCGFLAAIFICTLIFQ